MTAERSESFGWPGGELLVEGVPVREIAARHGTPLYVYSGRALLEGHRAVADAFAALSPVVCFSVKSCANIHVLRLLAGAGCGFDVVSGGELARVLEAGGDPGRIVFAGVGKTEAEMEAALEADILLFNVESEEELLVLDRVARDADERASVALRVNPEVRTGTHEYVATGEKATKFGLDPEATDRVLERARGLEGVEVAGLHAHIGSQIREPGPFARSAGRLRDLVERARDLDHPVRWLDLGGGFGIDYRGLEAPAVEEIAGAVLPELEDLDLRLVLEPGRSVAGNAGALVTSVLYRKTSGGRRFLVVDAAMNDLLRPALYDAFHWIWPVRSDRDPRRDPPAKGELDAWDVVGPICETGDFLAKDRALPEPERGDLLSVLSAGAYGFTMASNYNARPRAPEVLVRDGEPELVRRRETMDDLLGPERDLGKGAP